LGRGRDEIGRKLERIGTKPGVGVAIAVIARHGNVTPPRQAKSKREPYR
jgi:hypothetical protein